MRIVRVVRVVALGLFVAAVAVLAGVGWIASERAIHPRAAVYGLSLQDFPDLHPQEVSFDSRTKAHIAASFFPGNRRATIVLSHGYGDNQAQMIPYAEFLHQDGYSVLTYDMRNRGHSTGDAVTLGALEEFDLQSAIDYLESRNDVDRDRIGALGVSLGGSTTLLAAASDSRIKAVVDDSGFSDAPNVIESSFEHFIGLPPFPFVPVTTTIVAIRTGFNVNHVRPVDVVGQISPRPLLIIHCANDKVVPPSNSERNFAAAKEPKQIWRIPTGGHIDGHVIAREEYERRVREFFDHNLR